MIGLELLVSGALLLAKPILEEFLKDFGNDLAKDAGKSTLGKIYKTTFSKLKREPLLKATGLALKEFLELMENELLDNEVSEKDIQYRFLPFVKVFVNSESFLDLFEPLFTDPQFQLDAGILARTWQDLPNAPDLPEEFSWEHLAKAFKRKIKTIRDNHPEIQQAFEHAQTTQSHTALLELSGLPPEFDQEAYREALLEKFQDVGFDCLDSTGVFYNEIRLWNIFVPQSCRETQDYKPQLLEMPKEHQKRLLERGEIDAANLEELERLQAMQRQRYFEQPLRPILEVCADPSLANLVILGDPGSGKSSLLRYLALRWANLPSANERLQQALPLLIELRAYNLWECPSGKSFLHYLHAARTWHRLNQQTLNHLMQQPDRVILLLDGLDEVFDPVQREQVIHDIHRFSNDYKQVRIIVTSRVVGYQPKALRDAQFRDFMLQDLDSKQIQTFLEQWHATTFETSKAAEAELKRERLAKAIASSKSIALLAGNPLLLTMMAILNRHQELPRHRAALYQKASEVLLHQWDTERALEAYPELRNEFDLSAKVALLRRIAEQMQNAPEGLAGNIITGEKLSKIIETYLREELHFAQARGAANAVVKQLRERNFILCFIGANSYAFVHRAFLEYFCAADIVYKFTHQRALSIEDLIGIFDAHYADDAWREVLRLICGQIDEQFVGQIVEHLINKTDLDALDTEAKLPEIILAAFCLGEARNSSRLVKTGEQFFKKIERLFISFNNPSDGFFKSLHRAFQELGQNWPKLNLPTELPNFSQGNVIRHFFWPLLLQSLGLTKQTLTNFLESDLPYIRSGSLLALCEFDDQYPDIYNLLRKTALEDTDQWLRSIALEQLVKKWPDDQTRALLQQRALEDMDEAVRCTALEQLAKQWPNEQTRTLLQRRAVEDEAVRSIALEQFAAQWPDDQTRALLQQHVVEDMDEAVRCTALEQLAKQWPDDQTRILLQQRAVEDEAVRGIALEQFATQWPDDQTRALLQQRAVEDTNNQVRRTALEQLVKKWPNDQTRILLQQRAVEDMDEAVRLTALEQLVKQWPDEQTRTLLERLTALEQLVKQWPDDQTRTLLQQRAVEDTNNQVRRTALEQLVKQWPDDQTRIFLQQRAVEDTNNQVRRTALEQLVKQWPDDQTRILLQQRALEDIDEFVREIASEQLIEHWSDLAAQAWLRL
ncbi:HEAT repeat domain-containing protein, partial [Thiolinea disciformis]|uniref:HEAT repeat domain-containing protein n=1 Tax=Thiolinea disciformis TaxID=125614 RepID=UPI0003754001